MNILSIFVAFLESMNLTQSGPKVDDTFEIVTASCIAHVSKFGARLCKDSLHTLSQTPHIYTTQIFACFLTLFGDQIPGLPS